MKQKLHPILNNIEQEINEPFVIDCDPGDCVLCDICNTEMEDQTGGCLVGSWFFCEECAKTISHPEEITAVCPSNLTNKQWIINFIR